jgi:putative transposase
LCEALGVSRGGFYAWLTRPRSQRSRSDEELGAKVRASFLGSDRTYGARRVWKDLAAEGVFSGLHRIERLMRLQALKARPRRRRLPPDLGERQAGSVAPNVLDRGFEAPAPNRKWIADFTYVWTAEGWLYVAAVIDLFSRRVVGWSMSAGMTAQLVTDALVMAIWRRGKPDALLHHSDRGSQYSSEQFQRLMADHGVVCSMKRSDDATPAEDEPVPGFDIASNSQDRDIARVEVKVEKQDAAHATVAAKLFNKGPRIKYPASDDIVRYDFVRENGRWLIDNVRSTIHGKEWTIRGLLNEGLKL